MTRTPPGVHPSSGHHFTMTFIIRQHYGVKGSRGPYNLKWPWTKVPHIYCTNTHVIVWFYTLAYIGYNESHFEVFSSARMFTIHNSSKHILSASNKTHSFKQNSSSILETQTVTYHRSPPIAGLRAVGWFHVNRFSSAGAWLVFSWAWLFFCRAWLVFCRAWLVFYRAWLMSVWSILYLRRDIFSYPNSTWKVLKRANCVLKYIVQTLNIQAHSVTKYIFLTNNI